MMTCIIPSANAASVPGLMGKIPVGASRSAGAVGINHHQLCAAAASFDNERPQMDIISVNVRGPRDDVARMAKLLRLSAELHAENRFQPSFAGSGANVARQAAKRPADERTGGPWSRR